MFQAIRVSAFGGPEKLVIEQLCSLVPKTNQVLVQVYAAGVNPVETYIRSGTHSIKPNLPYTPGKDGAGVIKQVGDNVKKFKPGDRVYISNSLSGTYAQEALCTESSIHPLPENISFIEGAAVSTAYLTAYRALIQRGCAKPGETVLVHGASGGVGTAAIQLCGVYGVNAIGTASSAQGMELVMAQGAKEVLNHSSTTFCEELMKLTNGKGVNLILEMLANVNLQKDLTMLNQNGRIAVIGNRGTIEINPREAMNREADIRGVYLPLANEQELNEAHAAIYAGFIKGLLKPVIGATFPLSEASIAHKAVISPSPSVGKVVLDCTE